ncbi:MAG: tRNA pseudouridine(55) synthase TruB, partial [Oscillospiraceae bacterium]|nr:tRNA pseudouridine(55) synthase TruB [Oscillospiraceae bacterium]
FTSFDVIAKMRGILKMKRWGHAGTLDPMATGVLPVFAGRATKACDILPDHDKTYEAGFRLGITTDTQDVTGTVTKERPAKVTTEQLENVLGSFRGEIMQVPPMYSAVSVGGKRLYELARQGKEIEREARAVTIYCLEITEFDEPSQSGTLKVSCSKGTYIRTLINDIGEALNCGGIMTSLVRTAACGFTLSDCVTLEQLQEAANSGGDFTKFVRPIESVFEGFPELRLSPAQEKMYRNGVKLSLDKIKISGDGATVKVYGSGGFIGTALPDHENGILRVHKNFF